MRKSIFTALLLISLALVLGTPVDGSQSSDLFFVPVSVSVAGGFYDGSEIAGFFTEPFETVVFRFRDGSFLTFSTNEGSAVGVPISWVTETIEKNGHAVSDIVLCVHNHFTPTGFTLADRRSCGYLRDRGFRGVFGIYYTATGRFRELGEKLK